TDDRISRVNETSGRVAACPRHAVSSDLTRLRFGRTGGLPCQGCVARFSRAVPTRAHSPTRLGRAPPECPLTAGSRVGAAQPEGSTRPRRQADQPASAAGCRRGTSRCQTADRQAYTVLLLRANTS